MNSSQRSATFDQEEHSPVVPDNESSATIAESSDTRLETVELTSNQAGALRAHSAARQLALGKNRERAIKIRELQDEIGKAQREIRELREAMKQESKDFSASPARQRFLFVASELGGSENISGEEESLYLTGQSEPVTHEETLDRALRRGEFSPSPISSSRAESEIPETPTKGYKKRGG